MLYSKWTNSERTKLYKLFHAGALYSDIAKLLNRSIGAIMSEISHMEKRGHKFDYDLRLKKQQS